MTSKPRRFRKILVASGLTLAVAIGGCAVASESDQRDRVSAQELRRGKHWRGPAKVVIDVARAHAELSIDQATVVDDIAGRLEINAERKKLMKEQFRASAADIVRAGTADSDEFDDTVDEVVALVEERMETVTAAMTELHDTLDADQRLAVADVLHARIEKRFGPRRAAALDAAALDERANDRRRTGFKRFAKHLALTTLQVDKLRALRDEMKGERRRFHPTPEELHGLVDAFADQDAEGRSFEQVADAFHADKLEILRARFARAGERTDTVLSILSEGQRDLLADLIVDGPKKVLFGDQPPTVAAAPELR
jgi:hypothetical protein